LKAKGREEVFGAVLKVDNRLNEFKISKFCFLTYLGPSSINAVDASTMTDDQGEKSEEAIDSTMAFRQVMAASANCEMNIIRAYTICTWDFHIYLLYVNGF